jgi:N-acetylneuraminic acid mutarotase
VYDPVRDKLVLFGGNDFTKVFNDLWQYDYSSNTWINITPDYSPEARQLHGMVYVPDRDVILLFGGRRLNGGAAFSDIWELDCSTYTWTKLDPENNPGVSDHVNITYDLSAQKVLLYIAPDIWAYDFNSNDWTELLVDNKPNLDHSSFIYDPKHKKTVLFGNLDGFNRYTWIFDYSTNTWMNITPKNMLDVRIEHDWMVYLEDEQVFIQYGGCCSDATLELKLNR